MKHLTSCVIDFQYAILDECTSAVTLEIEKVMYDHATSERRAHAGPQADEQISASRS